MQKEKESRTDFECWHTYKEYEAASLFGRPEILLLQDILKFQ
jgi:hypothetical protein